jgi:tetratricopeptide (TPR) repeat protein
MARDDWFRNTTWSPEIEAAFFERLRRSQDKSQYLRIQASTLAKVNPDVALRLLDHYFALGENIAMAQAHADRAEAYLAKGDVAAAVEAFEAALIRERAYPRWLTRTYLELPYLIAVRRLSERYAQALGILEINKGMLAFPVDHYLWNGAHALILSHQGKDSDAKAFAEVALTAASETQSAFRYHQKIGLVGTAYDEFGERVQAIAGTSH